MNVFQKQMARITKNFCDQKYAAVYWACLAIIVGVIVFSFIAPSLDINLLLLWLLRFSAVAALVFIVIFNPNDKF